MSDLVVVGLGYVGMPLVQTAVRAGLAVTGLEVNTDTVSALNSGISHLDDLTDGLDKFTAGGEGRTEAIRLLRRRLSDVAFTALRTDDRGPHPDPGPRRRRGTPGSGLT